ncbi:Gfo/Idh/MocA family oxidoreductase [Paenibacillus alkalitolerans]|uniref:Gfo/Idh/MocA family oxidoreductase n=1 Tax=Paenibacillus alkalitolerans TaxID=2799335 RepID=UPI0018F537F3|nr:Gfo/Idh/MocA family oxidoreductase [Paenibacillus alkalitolerans]
MSNVSHVNAEVEDLSVAILRYPGGALAQITSSVVHHGEEQQLVFQGANARVSASWHISASNAKPNGFPVPNVQLADELQAMYDSLPEVTYEGHTGQVDNVLTAIETGAPILIDGESGRRTLELIVAIYKSASRGQNVNFPIGPDDPFYTREGMQENAIRFYEKNTSIENFHDNTITIGSDYKG